MRFYAVYRPYGLETLNRDGRQANTLLAFRSRAERDGYLADSDPAKVEALPSSSPLVRRLRRRDCAEWWSSEFVDAISFLD